MAVQPWLEGFTHVDLDYVAGDAPEIGRPYDDMSRPKVCLHTTEGDSVEGAEHVFRRFPPHIACEYDGLKRRQYLPLTHCSYSMKGDENDDEFVVQVEIVGHASNAPNFWEAELDWIGSQVLAPIWRAGVQFEFAIPPQGYHGADEGIVPYLATSQSPIRFQSEAALRNFSGVMGHQHAPAPDSHWDPGRMNVQRMLDACTAALGVPPVTEVTPTAAPVGDLLWPILRTTTRGDSPVHTRIVQQVCGAVVDGDFYIATAQAVRGYQSAIGLPSNGVVGKTTGTAIVQNVLRDMGYAPLTIDGNYDAATTAAVIQFQAANGLTADGYFEGQSTVALWYAMGQP